VDVAVLLVFEVAGDKLIERELLRMGDYAQDATPAFAAIGGFMMAETKEQFATEGHRASGGWAPLAPSTIQKRGGAGRSGGAIFTNPGGGGGFTSGGPVRILHDTGALEQSLTEPKGANQILEVTPQELVFGSRLPYAHYHQTGTRRMPRRRPLEFTEAAKRDMVKILQRFVVTGEVAA
jgi:hypothetical protein